MPVYRLLGVKYDITEHLGRQRSKYLCTHECMTCITNLWITLSVESFYETLAGLKREITWGPWYQMHLWTSLSNWLNFEQSGLSIPKIIYGLLLVPQNLVSPLYKGKSVHKHSLNDKWPHFYHDFFQFKWVRLITRLWKITTGHIWQHTSKQNLEYQQCHDLKNDGKNCCQMWPVAIFPFPLLAQQMFDKTFHW